MRQRGWLHFLIPAGCWLEEFSCDTVSNGLADHVGLRYASEATTGGLGKDFLPVGSGLKESGILVDNRRYFRWRRIEGCDKGCSVSLVSSI